MDEATSALDSETEQQVWQNLQKVAADRTIVMMAHRFAPLRKADLILVMEKGVVVVERGTHDELVQKKVLITPFTNARKPQPSNYFLAMFCSNY